MLAVSDDHAQRCQLTGDGSPPYNIGRVVEIHLAGERVATRRHWCCQSPWLFHGHG